MNDLKKCICERVKESRIGTTKHFIHEMKILIHSVPHYYCEYCNSVSYDGQIEIDRLLKIAYQLRIKEIDWNNREKTTVVFNVDADEELQQHIQYTINQNLTELVDRESFGIMYDNKIIVGQKLENFIVVERIIEKVI